MPVAAAQLRATLAEFRARHGFGRAVAAPPIGVSLRLVALRLPGWPDLLVNPEITWNPDTVSRKWRPGHRGAETWNTGQMFIGELSR